MKSLLSALLVSAAVLSTPALAASAVVTIYAADGLHDGKGSWFETQFDAFTKATGVKVQYVEAGSGGVVERVAKEKSNPQADVLVTLPPFIQRADAEGLLQKFTPAAAAEIDGGSNSYQPLVDNYLSFIYNSAALKAAPATYDELLDPKFKGASTGKLTALVNKGELYVANGDVQMNMSQMADDPNIRVFWPAGPNGERSALPLPYYIGLVAGAPDADNGKKLIDFLLAKEAQETVSSVAIGVPVRKDVKPTDANFTRLQDALKGVTVWTPDWAQVLKDLPADVKRWHEVTGS